MKSVRATLYTSAVCGAAADAKLYCQFLGPIAGLADRGLAVVSTAGCPPWDAHYLQSARFCLLTGSAQSRPKSPCSSDQPPSEYQLFPHCRAPPRRRQTRTALW